MAKNNIPLGVNLTLDASQLKSASVAAVGTLNKFDKSVRSIGVGSIAAGAAIGNLASGAITSLISRATSAASSLKSLVANAFTTVDAQAKLGDSFGLSQAQVAAFSLAADKAGTSIEAMRPAMQKMQQTIADAATGGKTAIESLADVGLTADDFIGKDALESLRMVSGGLAKVESAARRAKAAQEIFGRGAAQGGSFLLDASEALADATEKTIRYGTALDGLDAAKIELADDAMRDLKEAANGLWVTIAVNLAPTITALSDYLANDFPMDFRAGVRTMIADLAVLVVDINAAIQKTKTAAEILWGGDLVNRHAGGGGKLIGQTVAGIGGAIGSKSVTEFGLGIFSFADALTQDANERLDETLKDHERRMNDSNLFVEFFKRAISSAETLAGKIEENRRKLREFNAASDLLGSPADEEDDKAKKSKAMRSPSHLSSGLTLGSQNATNLINRNADRMQQQAVKIEEEQKRIAIEIRNEIRLLRQQSFRSTGNEGLPADLSVLRF